MSDDKPEWERKYDELHIPDRFMPGPWTWDIHDYSMATLCGGGEDAITGHIMAIGPCEACRDRARGGAWVWGRCQTPSEPNALLIASAPDLYEALSEARLQIAYLHEKFKETGTGNSVLSKIDAALSKARGEKL